MMVTGGMAVMLLVLLTLTGFKISLEDIKKVSERRGLVSCLAVLGVQFVAGPVMVACFSALLQMKPDWVVGLMVFSCTPPTVAAPVIAFMVGADVALALSAAIFTLGCSIVLTPLCFAGAAAGGRTACLLPFPHKKINDLPRQAWDTHQKKLKNSVFPPAGGMALYNALGGAGQGADSTRLKLPIPQIVGTMLALMLCCAIGVTANAKLTPEKKAKVEKVLKIILVPALIVGTVGFFVTDGCVTTVKVPYRAAAACQRRPAAHLCCCSQEVLLPRS